MPWPVYLAFKHLFPTGRQGARASVLSTLRLSFFLATGLFLIVVGFLWWNGVIERMRVQIDPPVNVPLALTVLWLWLMAGVALAAIIFRSTPFFNAMSIFGITLGVTVLITVQSVMNGFAYQYERVFIETQGHLDVSAEEPIQNPREVVNVIKQIPGVTLAEPVMNGVVMLRFQNLPAFPLVRTFDMNSPDAARDPLAKNVLFPGKFDDLDDQSILVGAGLARDLDLHIGDSVDVYTPRMLDEIKRDEVPMPKELKVVGKISTGWTEIDDHFVFLSLRLMRQLYGFSDEAHHIEVRLDNDDLGHTLDMRDVLQKALQPLSDRRIAAGDRGAQLTVETWQEMNKDQLQILFVEKSVMFYIMIVIVIVAAFCILCSLATSVVRKTREIGVLGAMGARPRQVAAVFCLQGVFIGLVGAVLGVVLAKVLLDYRQEIVTAFVDQRLLERFYKFYSFPVKYRALDFVKIIGFTFLISTLAGVLPALWAARLKPAECLRYE